MKKQNQTYNDGILEIQEKHTLFDQHNTRIGAGLVTIKRFWFRKLGVTSEEQYFAMQVDTKVSMRVAIPKRFDIDSNMKVKIKNKVYGIARVFYSDYKKETELTLVEVNKHERKE